MVNGRQLFSVETAPLWLCEILPSRGAPLLLFLSFLVLVLCVLISVKQINLINQCPYTLKIPLYLHDYVI